MFQLQSVPDKSHDRTCSWTHFSDKPAKTFERFLDSFPWRRYSAATSHFVYRSFFAA